jgi:transposase
MIMDETDLHLCPDLDTNGLHPLGQQTILRAPGQDDVAYLFGSADPFGGDGLFEIYDRKRSEEFCLHLEHLLERYPSRFLFIGCDNAPSHQSHDTQLYLKDKQDDLELVYFPTYSPNLNGMEHLWRYLRKDMTRNTLYENLPTQCLALCGWLEDLPYHRIIQTLGTVKKLTKTK